MTEKINDIEAEGWRLDHSFVATPSDAPLIFGVFRRVPDAVPGWVTHPE